MSASDLYGIHDPPPAYTTPGEDLFKALSLACAEDSDTASRALDSLGVLDWRQLPPNVRAIFDAAAAAFLSE